MLGLVVGAGVLLIVQAIKNSGASSFDGERRIGFRGKNGTQKQTEGGGVKGGGRYCNCYDKAGRGGIKTFFGCDKSIPCWGV